MKSTKVKETEIYKDARGEHIVCKGKLVLIECIESEAKIFRYSTGDGNWDYGLEKFNVIGYYNLYYKPIIISETEKIEVGDTKLTSNLNICLHNSDMSPTGSHKILVLSEHFPKKHLEEIVNGELKDGDEMFVKCDIIPNHHGYTERHKGCILPEYEIHLNKDNNAEFFLIKKQENWNDIRLSFSENSDRDFIFERMEKYYNPPTPK